MAQLRATGPYIWVTWLPRLLSGGSSCEWSIVVQGPARRLELEPHALRFGPNRLAPEPHRTAERAAGEVGSNRATRVLTEGQNSFNLRGSSAVLAGKPDLVARRRDQITVIDAKTGRPSPAHTAQVLIYMYALPRRVGTLQGAEHRRPSGLPRSCGRHTGRCSRREVSSRTWAASSAAWRRRCRPDG